MNGCFALKAVIFQTTIISFVTGVCASVSVAPPIGNKPMMKCVDRMQSFPSTVGITFQSIRQCCAGKKS